MIWCSCINDLLQGDTDSTYTHNTSYTHTHIMSGADNTGTGNDEAPSLRQRTNPNLKDLNNFELHLVDESYDESADPDFTLGNVTGVSISDIDIDDEEDESDADSISGESLGADSDDGDDDITALDDSDTDLESSIANDEKPKVDAKTETLKETLKSHSSLSLPIHEKFYSFVHKNEIPRKLFHVSIGFVTLYLHCNGYKTKNTWQPVSIAVSCIFLLDLIRFNWPYFNKLYCAVVGILMREKEINSINGVIWFQLGSIITFAFQKQDVSIMSALLLSWSDTAASTIGRKYGYLSPKLARGKSLVGSIAAFVTGIIACYVFYGFITPRFPEVSQDFEYDPKTNILNLHTLALLSGFIASVSEGIDIAGLDDNLTIPVLSGLFLSSVIKLGKTSN